MTKKIIALMAVVTIVFVCTFAACDKGTYTNPASGTKYDLVTDENGEKVLADDGELLVYALDENGKYVTNESGELETQEQAFIGQIEEDGVVEDFAYYLTLPDGWKTTDKSGVFENKSKSQTIEISVVEYLYKDYYETNRNIYEDMLEQAEEQDIELGWEDDVDAPIDGSENAFKFTVKTEEYSIVLLVVENSGNVYKIRFISTGSETDAAEFDAFCQNITFKPYTYYPDVTAKSEATE